MIFCCNCESEATHKVIHHDNKDLECPLCTSCKEAYEWGQASPEATVCLIGEHPEDQEGDDEDDRKDE